MAKKNKYYEDPDRSDVSNDRTSGLGEYTANYQTAMNMADENLASAQAKSQAIANTAQEQKTKAESYARAVGDNPTLGFTGDSQFYEGGYGYKPADEAAKKYQQTAEEKNSYADVFDDGIQQTPKSN